MVETVAIDTTVMMTTAASSSLNEKALRDGLFNIMTQTSKQK
jgi:hypothetical protein